MKMAEEGEGVLVPEGMSSTNSRILDTESESRWTHPEAKMMELIPVNRSPLVSSMTPSSIRELEG